MSLPYAFLPPNCINARSYRKFQYVVHEEELHFHECAVCLSCRYLISSIVDPRALAS